MTNYLLALVSLATITACSGSSEGNTTSDEAEAPGKNYKAYYYPVEELSEPKVYYFKPDDLSAGELFWVMTRVEKGGKAHLATDSYLLDPTGKLKHIEYIEEEINEEGAFIKRYVEYQEDTAGSQVEAPAKMNHGQAFAWNLKPDNPLIWEFESKSTQYFEDSYSITMKRSRVFKGPGKDIDFEGQAHEAITFSDSFEMDFVNSATKDKQDFDFMQTSYYAKGIGLYKYTRNLPDGDLTYTLDAILSLEDWTKLKEAAIMADEK